MTTAVAIFGRRAGLIAPTRSTAQSESATKPAQILAQIRRHLLDSYTVRQAAETAINELEEVRAEALLEGWDGYAAKAMHPDAYKHAKLFLETMPTTAPVPEVGADPDGDVVLDWIFGERRALSVSISATGRCVFASIRGLRTCRGTDWLDDDGIPAPIADALWRLAQEAAPVRRVR